MYIILSAVLMVGLSYTSEYPEIGAKNNSSMYVHVENAP